MASETDISDAELPEKDDLGEGPERYEGEEAGDDDVEDEDDEAANDLVDDAALATGQAPVDDDGEFASGEGSRGLS